MKILAIESSTKHFSMAISEKGKIVVSFDAYLEKMLSTSIIPSIERLLKKSRVKLKDIDGFAVGLGPGSFTSLRVGLSTVKALAYVMGKPVVGIPSLDVLAMNAVEYPAATVCTICDARRGLVFASFYQLKSGKLIRKTKYLLADINDILKRVKKGTCFIGDAVGLYADLIERKFNIRRSADYCLAQEKLWFPKAGSLAKLSQERFRQKKHDSINKIVPLYLYPDDCQVR